MEKVTTIGLDIARSVFRVHGVGAAGEVVVGRQLTRARRLPFFASCRAVLWASTLIAPADRPVKAAMLFAV